MRRLALFASFNKYKYYLKNPLALILCKRVRQLSIVLQQDILL